MLRLLLVSCIVLVVSGEDVFQSSDEYTSRATPDAFTFSPENLEGLWLNIDQHRLNKTVTAQDIASSEAVWLLTGLVPPEICDELVELGVELASDYQNSSPSKKVHDARLIRIPTQRAEDLSVRNGKKRNKPHWFTPPMPDVASSRTESVFRRLLATLDESFPSLVEGLFGDKEIENEHVSLVTLFEENQLDYTSREPAINVYTQGGEFRPHEDGQSLTVLLTLTENELFAGGGTAFWPSDMNHRENPPTLTLKPSSKGSLLLFGGSVTHSGRPLEQGHRLVLVASFGRKKSPKGAPTTQSEASREEAGASNPDGEL